MYIFKTSFPREEHNIADVLGLWWPLCNGRTRCQHRCNQDFIFAIFWWYIQGSLWWLRGSRFSRKMTTSCPRWHVALWPSCRTLWPCCRQLAVSSQVQAEAPCSGIPATWWASSPATLWTPARGPYFRASTWLCRRVYWSNLWMTSCVQAVSGYIYSLKPKLAEET